MLEDGWLIVLILAVLGVVAIGGALVAWLERNGRVG